MVNKSLVTLFLCIIIITAVGLSGCTNSVTTPSPTASAPKTVTITDSNGQAFTLPTVANRIVVTNSNAAEVLIAIGAVDKIVGGTSIIKTDPTLSPYLTNITDVGDWQNPSIENIIALKPDVVITYSSPPLKNLDQFKAANITVIALDCYKINNLTSDVKAMGILTGDEQNATTYGNFIDQYYNMVASRVANLTDSQKPLVYWEQNKDYSTAGKGSGGDNLINLVGGRNVFGNETASYPLVSAESVTQADPQIVVKTVTYGASLQNITTLRNNLMNRTGMGSISAVKNDKVYILSGSIALGPRGLIGLLYMAKIVHPELFTDLDPAAVQNAYAEKFVSGTNVGVFIYPTP
jgi:iron complex transport system substrate-binding protein